MKKYLAISLLCFAIFCLPSCRNLRLGAANPDINAQLHDLTTEVNGIRNMNLIMKDSLNETKQIVTETNVKVSKIKIGDVNVRNSSIAWLLTLIILGIPLIMLIRRNHTLSIKVTELLDELIEKRNKTIKGRKDVKR